MIVTTMSGRSVLETEYSMHEECRVYQVLKAIQAAAIRLNLATFQTKLDLVLSGALVHKPLRGNTIIKRKTKKHVPKCHHDRLPHRGKYKRQTYIWQYFKWAKGTPGL